MDNLFNYQDKEKINSNHSDCKDPKYKNFIVAGNKNNSKLSISDVLEIKLLLSKGDLSCSKIAKIYNVSRVNIQNIKDGRRWADIF